MVPAGKKEDWMESRARQKKTARAARKTTVGRRLPDLMAFNFMPTFLFLSGRRYRVGS